MDHARTKTRRSRARRTRESSSDPFVSQTPLPSSPPKQQDNPEETAIQKKGSMAKKMKTQNGQQWRQSVNQKDSTSDLLRTSVLFINEWIIVCMLIFGGCCSNVYTLEKLVRSSPKSGNLITLAQFLIVAMDGFYRNVEWTLPFPRLKPRQIPLRQWGVIVALFWLTSVINNYALGFKIAMPLHIIFRSSSILVSLLLSMFWLKRSFSAGKMIGVVVVTVGVILTTLSSRPPSSTSPTSGLPSAADLADFQTWCQGILLLALAVVLSCILGQYQQLVYETFGKHWQEGLFYIHALGLIPFVFLSSSLAGQVAEYNASPRASPWPFAVPWLKSIQLPGLASGLPLFLATLQVPTLWVDLMLNMITQYFCISGVQKLSSMTTSVTLNLILGIRKFISLMLSVVLFSNPFTPVHGVGTLIVVVGTIVYAMY